VLGNEAPIVRRRALEIARQTLELRNINWRPERDDVTVDGDGEQGGDRLAHGSAPPWEARPVERIETDLLLGTRAQRRAAAVAPGEADHLPRRQQPAPLDAERLEEGATDTRQRRTIGPVQRHHRAIELTFAGE